MRRLHAIGLFMLISGCAGGGATGAKDASVTIDARVPKSGDPCVDRRDCDDGIFCNGVEECISNRCISARNSACRDHGGCAVSICEESAGGCRVETMSDGARGCGTTQACLPELGCTAIEGCSSVGDPKCDDGRSCTADRCDIASGRCIHDLIDARCPGKGACGIGVCIGATTSDPSGCDLLPDASKCTRTEGCDATFACSSLTGRCDSDRACSDGTLCDGVEQCIGGTCVHDPLRTRCEAIDSLHHARCVVRSLGDPYCVNDVIPAPI